MNAEHTSPNEKPRHFLAIEVMGEPYCVSIEHVTGVVDVERMYPLNIGPSFLEGLLKARGNTIVVINPNKLLEDSPDHSHESIVIFDPALFETNQSLAWSVAEVKTRFTAETHHCRPTPNEGDYVGGIVSRPSQDLVWVKPHKITPDIAVDELE